MPREHCSRYSCRRCRHSTLKQIHMQMGRKCQSAKSISSANKFFTEPKFLRYKFTTAVNSIRVKISIFARFHAFTTSLGRSMTVSVRIASWWAGMHWRGYGSKKEKRAYFHPCSRHMWRHPHTCPVWLHMLIWPPKIQPYLAPLEHLFCGFLQTEKFKIHDWNRCATQTDQYTNTISFSNKCSLMAKK